MRRAVSKSEMTTRSIAQPFVAVLLAGAIFAPSGAAQAEETLDYGSYEVAQIVYDVFIDEYGREVLVDPDTGEIVGYADKPRRNRWRDRRARRQERRLRRLDRMDNIFEDDGYNDGVVIERIPDDELEMERLPRRARRGFFLDELEERRRQEAERNRRAKKRKITRKKLPPVSKPRTRDPEVVIVDPALRDGNIDRENVTGAIDREPSQTKSAFRDLKRSQVARLQVFLDREGFSPGVIDGGMGSNVRKAMEAWKMRTGRPENLNDPAMIDRLLAEAGGEAFTTYTITEEDVRGPYISNVPSDYSRKAELKNLAFTSPVEMIAEKFHMSETYLRNLNQGVDFYRAGSVVQVVNPGMMNTKKVHYIIADKGKEQVRAYDRNGTMVAAYPATIGSTDTPSPTGIVEVKRVAFNPEYTYNPKINFTQGENKQILRIPPGPNGPVGSIWIALSKKTYGIHGTPNPDTIGKTNSHGCIRLTNWDAQELAKLVKPGVKVEFVE